MEKTGQRAGTDGEEKGTTEIHWLIKKKKYLIDFSPRGAFQGR